MVAPTPEFPFLNLPGLRALLALLNREGEEARVVGGAVRNTLMGLPVTDIDVATTALPNEVMARASRAGLRAVPTGIDHGTVTVIAAGTPFEVTTLREDLETDGRHATVRFGRSWQHDAERRDFTINALYLTADGKVIDLVGGLADVAARRVRFIGDSATRIAEDRLRLLRFFRFQAAYGQGAPDEASLSAAVAAREGLTALSAERIGAEVVKLVRAVGAPDVLDLMVRNGVARIVFGGPIELTPFRAIHGAVGRDVEDVPVRLAALLLTAGDALSVAGRLRLSNLQRDRMVAILDAVEPLTTPLAAMDIGMLRRHLFRLGEAVFQDSLAVAAGRLQRPDLIAWARAAVTMPGPVPVTSADLRARGLLPGPAFGAALSRATEAWIASDFRADQPTILAAALDGATIE